MHIFKDDLKAGLKLEAEFKKLFPLNLIKLNQNKGQEKGPDFMLPDGTTIEIKSDSYHKTGNFFFERYSSKAAQTPGGPWQADIKHSEYFIHWFPGNKKYYIFLTAELVPFLNKYIAQNNPKFFDVMNDGYVTSGFTVKIEKLEQIMRMLTAELIAEFTNVTTPKSEQLTNGHDSLTLTNIAAV